jgi:hypothetical protein
LLHKGETLRWISHEYPSGLPGVGLLILRIGLAISLIQTHAWMFELPRFDDGMWAVGLLVILTSVCFILGFMTPLAGAISTLAVVSIYLWPMISRPTVAGLSGVSTLAMVSAITCLGPGSFSLDCLFFGRRKIIVPPITHS